MEEKTKRIATVGFDSAYQDDLHQVCKSLKMTKGQFLESCIQFTKRTGINPNNHLEDTRSQIKELRTTFISFQRNHEKLINEKYSKIEHDQKQIMEIMLELYRSMNSMIEKSEQTNKELQIVWSQLSQSK